MQSLHTWRGPCRPRGTAWQAGQRATAAQRRRAPSACIIGCHISTDGASCISSYFPADMRHRYAAVHNRIKGGGRLNALCTPICNSAWQEYSERRRAERQPRSRARQVVTVLRWVLGWGLSRRELEAAAGAQQEHSIRPASQGMGGGGGGSSRTRYAGTRRSACCSNDALIVPAERERRRGNDALIVPAERERRRGET